MKDAGKPDWVIELAKELKCEACQENIKGDQMVPGASTAAIPRSWEFVGMDTLELVDHAKDIKLKALLVMDLATHLACGDELRRMTVRQKQHESAQEVIMTLGKIWLMDKPKPKWWITDSGKSFDSKAFAEEAAEADIGEQVTPGKAP